MRYNKADLLPKLSGQIRFDQLVFDKILLKSFEYMGKSETIYEGLVNKFYYIQQENLFFVLPLRMMIRTA